MGAGKLFLLILFGIVLVFFIAAGVVVAQQGWSKTSTNDDDATAKAFNWIIEFYLSLIAYFILHMIFVISSDFVDAFNIPPLNIGIYVDKLAAIRALLMVIADLIEWVITQKCVNQQEGGDTGQDRLNTHLDMSKGKGTRRLGSIVSFIGMLSCRLAYLYLIYYSDNKSFSLFITLCLEGFWFGLFQMSFFAIGPQYNAVTSLGIHTMGNFIFFGQLLMQRRAKTHPYINCLYRVRVNAWICVSTSISALIAWIGFCIGAKGDGGIGALWNQVKNDANKDVNDADAMSPLLLFIVGAFAEDFAVPGVLPFALLDTERAALVNYLTPLFFMTGAFITFLLNDIFGGAAGAAQGTAGNCYFKEWSANFGGGVYWHALWLLNIPKYIAFFISMWCIHGTYQSLRCIVQCRWRVMMLTMFIVVPRAWLETAGYVGVANYALARAAVMKKDGSVRDTTQEWDYTDAKYDGFTMIMVHDFLAMFCRFVYGKFAVGYNSIQISFISYI